MAILFLIAFLSALGGILIAPVSNGFAEILFGLCLGCAGVAAVWLVVSEMRPR